MTASVLNTKFHYIQNSSEIYFAHLLPPKPALEEKTFFFHILKQSFLEE